LSADVFS